MKISLVLLSALPLAGAFVPRPIETSSTTQLAMGGSKEKLNPLESMLKNMANNFKPMHGHGSLEDDLEEQWEAQQAILRNRQTKHIDKEHLQQKYKNPDAVKDDIFSLGEKKGEGKGKKPWGKFSP